MIIILRAIVGYCLLAVAAHAQEPVDAKALPRIDIGSGFSVTVPTGQGWRTTGAPASYYKHLGPEDHGLVFVATTGPSGISRQEIAAVGGPNGANLAVKLIARFVERAWKEHAAGMQDTRFERVEAVKETGGKYNFGKFFCGYSRIVVRDRGAPDGIPTRLRYVAYSCVTFPDMTAAANVSYSERGREQDMSDDAMAEGEFLARSLQRRE